MADQEKKSREALARERVRDSFGALSLEDALKVVDDQQANDEKVAAEEATKKKSSKAS